MRVFLAGLCLAFTVAYANETDIDLFIRSWSAENALLASRLAHPAAMTAADACAIRLALIHAGRRLDHSSGYPQDRVAPLLAQHWELLSQMRKTPGFKERLIELCPQPEYEPGL